MEPGPLLASGRDSDIFECGPGRVLRRSRRGFSMATEARTMEHVRAHGFPVPAVLDISDDGRDLLMERVDGPSMVQLLISRPWTLGEQGRTLARLHEELHRIRAPDWLKDAPWGSGDRLLHFDLHPLNVICSPDGPVVIDWPNAVRGDPNADVALTWILLSAGGIPSGRLKAALLGRGRSLLVHAFLRRFPVDAVRAHLRPAVEWKCRDPNMTGAERRSMQALADRHG